MNYFYYTTIMFVILLSACKTKKDPIPTPAKVDDCFQSSWSFSQDGVNYIQLFNSYTTPDSNVVVYQFLQDPDTFEERMTTQVAIDFGNYSVTHKYDANLHEVGIPDTSWTNAMDQLLVRVDHSYDISTMKSSRRVTTSTYNDQHLLVSSEERNYNESGVVTYMNNYTYNYTNGNCTSKYAVGKNPATPNDIYATTTEFEYFTEYPKPSERKPLFYQYGNPGKYLLKKASVTNKSCYSGNCSSNNPTSFETYTYTFDEKKNVIGQTTYRDDVAIYLKYGYLCR